MTALLTVLMDLLTDPRIGLPSTLLAVGVIAAATLYPRRRPLVVGHDSLSRESDRDSVSRTYLAIQQGRYGDLLAETYRRLNRAVLYRTGATFETLPWDVRRMEELGIEDARGLRRTQHTLDALEWRARRLEAGSWFRWDFWRTDESSKAHLIRQSEALFREVDAQLARLERSVP
jgi:hypothetical protein